MKLPNWLVFFLAGVFTAVILHAIYKRPQKPQHIIQTITDTVVVEKTRIQVRPLQPETLRVHDTLTHHDTIRVIEWREYSYRDSILSLSIVADTVRKFSYTLLQKQKTKEAGILLNTQSIVFYTKPARNFIVGAGWNFREKVPEIAVGVSVRW